MKNHIIVMGVSGCGKSTVGAELASAIGATFYDGDDFHPQSNIDKMAEGIPLNDNDRHPWLEKLVEVIGGTEGTSVTACSALKKQYRDILRRAEHVSFVFLEGDKETLLQRLTNRSNNSDHFMPSSLLDSQLNTLEYPTSESDIITVSILSPVQTIVKNVLQQL